MPTLSTTFSALDRATLSAIIDASSDAIMVADATGRLIAVNAPAQALMGIPPGTMISSCCSQHFGIFLPDDGPPCPADRLPILRALKGECVDAVNLVVRNNRLPDGRPIVTSATPLRDDAGQVCGALVVCKESTEPTSSRPNLVTRWTERSRSEQALFLLAEAGKTLGDSLDYRQALQGVADLTVQLMADQCLCDLLDNGKLKRIAWGARSENRKSIVGRSVEWLPIDKPLHPISRAIATGQPALANQFDDAFIEAITVNPEHAQTMRELEVESMLSVPIAAYGKLFGVFTITRSRHFGRCFDQSDVDLAVELGHRAGVAVGHALTHRDVIESENRFRILADTVPQIVWSGKSNGAIEYLSSRWTAITGLSVEDSLGWGWLSAVHPNDRERARGAWTQAGETSLYRAEYRLRTRSGDYRWFRSAAAPLSQSPGAEPEYFGVATDIDDDKRLEVRGTQQRAELLRSNSELEEFAYVVAHDLREPLRTVRSFSELLSRSLPEGVREQTRELSGFIDSGVARMDALIAGLLAYAHVNSNESEWACVDCNRVLQTTLSQLAATINASQGKLVYESLPTVRGSEIMLAQVFQNLISNALKYRGERAPFIRISAVADASDWVFRFEDNGAGIAPENHSRIFRLFQRLHAPDDNSIGLGLANCKKIIERHGGRIWVESEPGRGSCFLFTLPHSPAALAVG